jgi:hypothetical protein
MSFAPDSEEEQTPLLLKETGQREYLLSET